MTDYPYIKTFELVTGNYIYDVNKNSILKIKKNECFKMILEMQKFGIKAFKEKYGAQNEKTKDIDIMVEKGYLHDNNVAEIRNPKCDVCKTYTKNSLNDLILQVTQNCNLKCSYCPYAWDGYLERAHSNKTMSWDIAKKSIDLYLLNSEEKDELSFSFYGGEPLLEFDLIKQCMEYINQTVKSKKVIFNFTTNGTLITHEFLNFIKEFNFGIHISLDGPADVHNKNRKFGGTGEGSFQKIMDNLRIILVDFPEIAQNFFFNAVWDGENNINKITNFFNTDEVASHFDFNFETMETNNLNILGGVSENNKITEEQDALLYLMEIISNESQNNKSIIIEKLVRLLESRNKRFINKSVLAPIRFQEGPCIPGCAKLFVDVKGNMLPCEKSSDSCLNFGNVNNKQPFDYDKIITLLNLDNIVNDECAKCWAIRFCGQCMPFAANNNKLSRSIILEECQINRKSCNDLIKETIYLFELGIDNKIYL